MEQNTKIVVLEKVKHEDNRGRIFDNYIAKIRMRNTDFSLNFKPKGGKKMAELVFAEETQVDLKLFVDSYHNDKKDKDVVFVRAEAFSTDEETGEVFSCEMELVFPTDRELLNTYMGVRR